jgi:membrane-associated phospholipid phosphatase
LELTRAEQRRWREAFELLPCERFMLAVILAAGLVTGITTLGLQRDVNWPPFLVGFFAALALMAVGAYVRCTKGAPRIALALVGTAIFAGFTAVSSVFIFALLPLPNPMIDDQLTRIGHWMGYDWQALVLAMTNYPTATRALGVVYQSALPQLAVTICLLAVYDRAVTLHRFILAGIVTLAICVAIWWAFPSVGYVGTLPLSDEQMAAAGLIYPQNYGGYLTRLLQQGPGHITPEIVTGVVGFPSYHTVMACLVVWYCWRTVLFIPALLVNLVMLLATLVHGGHHLIDVIGGIAVFALGVLIANRLTRRQP